MVEHNDCMCIGPQNGKPLCPCQMKNVRIVDGRYVRVEDLGAAPIHSGDNCWKLNDTLEYSTKSEE